MGVRFFVSDGEVVGEGRGSVKVSEGSLEQGMGGERLGVMEAESEEERVWSSEVVENFGRD